MKKLILLFVLTVSSVAFSQSTFKDDVDILQSVYGKEKTELVQKYMALSGTQADAFAKVYTDYEVERKTLGQKKIQIIQNYATSYQTLNDEVADKLASEMIDNNIAYDKLYAKYYKQSKKAIGAVNALKFIQLEIYLQTIIRLKIQTEIPFIGEMDLIKTN